MLALLILLLVSASVPGSERPGQYITPNFKDADLTQVAESVSVATGKNFIVDPRVRGQVTMLSSTPETSSRSCPMPMRDRSRLSIFRGG
jgi:general secretion pathway protein D